MKFAIILILILWFSWEAWALSRLGVVPVAGNYLLVQGNRKESRRGKPAVPEKSNVTNADAAETSRGRFVGRS